jgi:hypothetical protein
MMKLQIDSQIYSLEATQKAAYRFIDKLTILIQSNGDQLDQQLRKQIKEETEPTRNLILAYAFSRSGLQG